MKVIDLIKGASLLLLMPLLMGHGVSFGFEDEAEPYVNSNMYNLALYCNGTGVVSFKTAEEEDISTFESVGWGATHRTKALKIHEGETFDVHIESSGDALNCQDISLEDDRGMNIITLSQRVIREGTGTVLDATYQLRSADFYQRSEGFILDSRDRSILSGGVHEFDQILTPGSLRVFLNSSLIYFNNTAGFSDPIIFDAVDKDRLTIVVSDVNSSGTMDPIWLHKTDSDHILLSYKLELSEGSESNSTYEIRVW